MAIKSLQGRRFKTAHAKLVCQQGGPRGTLIVCIAVLNPRPAKTFMLDVFALSPALANILV